MLKYASYILLGLLSSNSSIAAPEVTPAPLKWLPVFAEANKQKEVRLLSQSQRVNDESENAEYADFSGRWTGQCVAEDGSEDVDDITVNFEIMADADNLSFNYEGDVYNYKIGEDKGVHHTLPNGFFSAHYVFNWLNKSTLAFNAMYLSTASRGHVESGIVRVTFSREGDTLLISSEYDLLDDNQDLEHIKSFCKFTKQA